MFDDTSFFNFSSHWDGCVSDLTVASGGGTSIHWCHPDVFGSFITPKFQTTEFTCAVVTQQMILHAFGIEVSEAQLVYDATSNGWLTDGGTSINDMGKLLELYGISTHINYNGDLASIIDELSHGRKIIVPVNSTELWEGVTFWQRLFGLHNTGPDHAIVVKGIDFSDRANPMVIINDPGHPSGASQFIPLEHFLEAWNDSNYAYLATTEAPAGLAFDTSLGSGFNPDAGIYQTPEFWIDIAVRIAGVAIGTMLMDIFNDYGTIHSASHFSSPWDGLTDFERMILLLTI